MKHYFILLFSATLFTAACTNENEIKNAEKEQEIILQYNFTNNLNDVSGNNFHGVNDTAIDYVPDRFSRMNEAIRLNGPLHDSYLEIPPLGNKQIKDTFSVGFWFTITTAGTTNLFYKSDLMQDAETGHTVLTSSGKLRIILASGNGQTKEFDAIPSLAANTWHHFVLSVNSLSDVKIYLNGQLYNNQMSVSGSAATVGFFSSAAQVKGILGGKSSFVPCDGKLDDFRIYNYAISAVEVSALYNYHP